jgi:cytosine/adenosine deaminase-related metal-dependent hydrolase
MGQDGRQDIRLAGQRIAGTSPTGSLAGALPSLSLEGALALPGLINSHEHLDFNLFPSLGNRVYGDYTEWGKDIHEQNKTRIAEILKIPQPLRTRWGLYKNLLNGFTTVVNHGSRLNTGPEDLVTVFQDCHCLHSLATEKRWIWKLNGWRRRHGPIVLHIGEGTSAAAAGEIDRLRRWNLFRRPIVGVHGVAMQERQTRAFRALVWCPDSNYFLYNKTAPVDRLKDTLPILFGTDSTLSASWNGWRQMRLARNQGVLTDEELFSALTHQAARIWDFPFLGRIEAGYQADLVITRQTNWYDTDPEDLSLVIHRGEIRVFDASLATQVYIAEQLLPTGKYHPVIVGNSIKYVQGDLPGLIREIRTHDPEAILPVTVPI